jgi:NADH-quinone oxidoreductase subunit H
MLLLVPFIVLSLILFYAVLVVWAERKVAAFVQDRFGPLEVGPKGLMQTIADLLKLLQKEDILQDQANKPLMKWAPAFLFAFVLTAFASFPLSPALSVAVPYGILFFLAILAIDALLIFLMAWASNSKFTLLGGMRAIAQALSYEVPLTLLLLSVLLLTGTLDFASIAAQQGASSSANEPLFNIAATKVNVYNLGGIFTWNIFRLPLLLPVWALFFVVTLAECNRAPFDIPEADSELISGFHTEYSGFRFGFIMLTEYALMLLVAIIGVFLFLGAWHTPLPNIAAFKLADYTAAHGHSIQGIVWAAIWLALKVIVIVFMQMMFRWTFPRLRMDQLMHLCWKYFLPISLLLLVLSSAWLVWLN